MSNSNITIKDTYTVAEVVEISGMSISKIRSLIKSGDLIAETVNTTNNTGRKVRRTEIKLQDLVNFGMAHPEYETLHEAACAIKVSTDASFGGIPGAIDENAEPQATDTNVDPIEEMDPADAKVGCEPPAEPDNLSEIPQEEIPNGDPSAENTTNTCCPEGPGTCKADDTESYEDPDCKKLREEFEKFVEDTVYTDPNETATRDEATEAVDTCIEEIERDMRYIAAELFKITKLEELIVKHKQQLTTDLNGMKGTVAILKDIRNTIALSDE